MEKNLEQLSKALEGSLEWDSLHKTLYATDASVYKMLPLAVAFPKTVEDPQKLIVLKGIPLVTSKQCIAFLYTCVRVYVGCLCNFLGIRAHCI